MARRIKKATSSLKTILDRITEQLDESPIAPIGEMLRNKASLAIQFCDGHSSDLQDLARRLEEILYCLPSSFDDRFVFDSLLIKSISAEWRLGKVNLSDMVIPKSADQWGHSTLPLLAFTNESVPFVDLILFPGEDRLDSIDLLDYPFLLHELGHNALFKFGDEFIERFDRFLSDHINALKRLAIADRGIARNRSDEIISKIMKYWRPTANHYNWAHEIAADLIGVWTTGPAYIAAFADAVESELINPLKISQSHPPYEVRTSAISYAAKRLGWQNQLKPLSDLGKKWKHDLPTADNDYVALTDKKLVIGCVEIAMRCIHDLSLPPCTIGRVEKMKGLLNNDWTPDFGTDLLISAWLRWQNYDSDRFEEWEKSTIDSLS